MATRHRRSAPESGNFREKDAAAKPQAVKKRVPLSDITNPRTCSSFSSSLTKPLVPLAAKLSEKGLSAATQHRGSPEKSSSASFYTKLDAHLTIREECISGQYHFPSRASYFLAPRTVGVEFHALSPSPSCSPDSISLSDTMSICDSLGSPRFEYIDDGDTTSMESREGNTVGSLKILEDSLSSGGIHSRGSLVEMEKIDRNKLMDPQFCATIVCDIYENLRVAEVSKMPSMDFMELLQKDISASMRAILIDWLVEVAEEYRFVPETLFLAVNYIDRYLSGNAINKHQLQLLGVASMMIAAKYEEVCPPQVEEFCYITDNTYCKDEVLQMESTVLNSLKFEMTSPTANCFLRWFLVVARGYNEAPSIQLECLSSYLLELSLVEYSMLCYAPSVIAASSIFLAKYILSPANKPWNSKLGYYTLYRPSDLCECVKKLHHLCRSGLGPNVPAVRQKFSQHKYKFVAKKYCPASIPADLFED